MKLFARFLLTLSLMMTMGVAAHAQSPREQLQQMVEQLQRNPTDNSLRERVIKLAQEIKPPPAIPEEARRHFVEGTVIAKSAKDPKGQALAVESFKEGLKIAPWWGDAYYNLAVVQELAEQFDDAERSLRHYILTNPGDKEAREAQDRIYALSAKKRLAQRQAEEAEEAERKKQQAFIQNLAGIWRRAVPLAGEDPPFHGYEVYQLEITSNNSFSMKWLRNEGAQSGASRFLPFEDTYNGSISGRRIGGTASTLHNFSPWGCGLVRLQGTFDGSISDDGNIIRITERREGSPSCNELRNPSSYDTTYRKGR